MGGEREGGREPERKGRKDEIRGRDEVTRSMISSQSPML